MPVPETFPHAEERRLLYVALTRARRAVVLIAPPRRPSPFAVELLKDPHVTVTRSDGSPVEICPGCGQGALVERHGRFGPFVGCSAFPACKYTRDAHARPGPGWLLWRDPAAGGGPGLGDAARIRQRRALYPSRTILGQVPRPTRWREQELRLRGADEPSYLRCCPSANPVGKLHAAAAAAPRPWRFIVPGQPAVRAIARINDCGSATTCRAIRGGRPDQGLSLISAGPGRRFAVVRVPAARPGAVQRSGREHASCVGLVTQRTGGREIRQIPQG
jgi:hypothetical protein